MNGTLCPCMYKRLNLQFPAEDGVGTLRTARKINRDAAPRRPIKVRPGPRPVLAPIVTVWTATVSLQTTSVPLVSVCSPFTEILSLPVFCRWGVEGGGIYIRGSSRTKDTIYRVVFIKAIENFGYCKLAPLTLALRNVSSKLDCYNINVG